MANPITEFKGAGYGGFVTSMSAFSFHMKSDGGFDLFEKQTRRTSENSAMAFINFFLQFKSCDFDIIHIYEFNFSDLFYIVQKKNMMHSFLND
jgi:hypothetical protein